MAQCNTPTFSHTGTSDASSGATWAPSDGRSNPPQLFGRPLDGQLYPV
jgi:hypothetical protein